MTSVDRVDRQKVTVPDLARMKALEERITMITAYDATFARLVDQAGIDMILVMTVEPGFGGQAFQPEMMAKVRAARRLADSADVEIWVQVDGGVGPDTIEQCAAAGADVFVAGSAVFGAAEPSVMIEQLRASAENAARP